MSTTNDTDLTPELIDRVMRLSAANKDRLVGLLVAGEDGLADEPDAVREAWRAELARRVADVESGRVATVDADEVLAQARQRLRERYGV